MHANTIDVMHLCEAKTPPDVAEIRERICRATRTLMERDPHLLRYDLNERSITHKFADYLQREFGDWDVDCEYNRNHNLKKQLHLAPRQDIASDDLDAKTVFPDIIVHHRGTSDNLAVIEVKKSTNAQTDEWDMAKLRAFRSQLGYLVAVFVRIPTGARTGEPEFSWVPD